MNIHGQHPAPGTQSLPGGWYNPNKGVYEKTGLNALVDSNKYVVPVNPLYDRLTAANPLHPEKSACGCNHAANSGGGVGILAVAVIAAVALFRK